MLRDQLAALIEAAPKPTLDNLSRDVWSAHNGGLLSDQEAQELAEHIHQRRTTHRSAEVTSQKVPRIASEGSGAPSSKPARLWTYFPPKRPQRSPDKQQSLERRRTLAASGPMPPALACKFTVGELAVLKVVGDEVSTKGACILSLPEIAARAGIGLTKARMALRIAASLGLLTTEERRVPYRPNLTNVVRIISREWIAWIARGKPKPFRGGGSTFGKATDIKGLRKKVDRQGSGYRDQGTALLVRPHLPKRN